MPKKPKRPRDVNQLAKYVIDKATGQLPEEPEAKKRGSAGGKVGGPSRAATLTSDERREIARKAAKARWRKNSG